jgi:hypothetical protein
LIQLTKRLGSSSAVAPTTYVYISGTTPMPTAATGRRLQQANPGTGFTYILNTTATSQADASSTCNGIGGQLVAYKTLAEQVRRAAALHYLPQAKTRPAVLQCSARICWVALAASDPLPLRPPAGGDRGVLPVARRAASHLPHAVLGGPGQQ